jgi:hypothetical protein
MNQQLKTSLLVALLVCVPGLSQPSAEESYQLAFSTYFGGSDWEHARDVFVDRQGSIYMVGGTASSDFPTTPGAYDRTFQSKGAYLGDGGPCDVFVAKFRPDGTLIWSTLLGGPNYDRAYAVEVDEQGCVYIAGRAGPGFPTTPGAFQPEYGGAYHSEGLYGAQNGFAAKIAPNGDRLLWASYVGVDDLCRDLAIDSQGNIYVPTGWGTRSDASSPPGWFDTAFRNALQKKPAGETDFGIVKITNDGTAVLWATWLGGSGEDIHRASIRVDRKQRAYVLLNTKSTDIPTAGAGSDRTFNGEIDGYVAMLQADGSALVYGTYLGGSGNDQAGRTHRLAIDDRGNTLVAMSTDSVDFPTTPGAWDRTRNGPADIAVVKIGPDGALLQSTFIGGAKAESPDGVYCDARGAVFFVGRTQSDDFPVTADAVQRAYGGGQYDAIAVLLSPDFSKLLYSTYLGGPAYDHGRSAFLDDHGNLYLTGAADGPGWPTKNAYQEQFAGGGGIGWGNGDNVLAKFERTAGPHSHENGR